MHATSLSEWMRVVVACLQWPTLFALSAASVVALCELGVALGERVRGVEGLIRAGDAEAAWRTGQRRIERADLLGRVGPMLGLMGTLIPLGPGLAALGRGDVATLAQAVTVAFDTTVMGMAVGIVGFVLGRLRRRWYDRALDQLEVGHVASP